MKFPGQNTDLFFWINKVSAWCFFFKFWAGFSLCCAGCAGLHAAWFLSLGSFHTETHRYTPLLLGIKIIIVKFLLKITSLKMQSDCFGIKRSQKRPTDCSLHQALHIHYDTWRWNVIKDSKFQPSLVDKKVFKMWVLLGSSGYFLACTIFRTSFCWREVHIWKISTYIPKNLEYSWRGFGSLNTLWWED